MAAPVAVVALKEVHMSALLHTWPPTLYVAPRRAGAWPAVPATTATGAARALGTTFPPTPPTRALCRSVSEFADEIGGSIGAALKAGKADLNSCKLSHCCIAAGVDLSSSAHGRGAHGDEKLTSKDGAVFLSTPGEWQAALRARLGAPHHCKDVAAAMSRTGILIHGGALSLLHSGAKHELEGFAGDAWLFELPRCVAAVAAVTPLPPRRVPPPAQPCPRARPAPTIPTTPTPSRSERGQGAKKQPRSSRSPQRSVAADGHGGR